MQLDPHAILIYTDSSCYRNPGGGEWVRRCRPLPDNQILSLGADGDAELDFVALDDAFQL